MKRILCSLALVVLAAPATASPAQEPPLICFGTEPFWRLDLTEAGQARFSTPDCPSARHYVGAASTLAPRGESIWRGRASAPNGGDLVAFVRKSPCSDNMSDAAHPYSVNVSLPDGTHRAGCCRLAKAPAAAEPLENTSWRLTTLPGASLPAVQGRDAVTITFAGGQVHGFAGCNQFFGPYAQTGDRLEFGSLGATMMACAEPAMSIENRFLKSLSGGMRVAVTASELTLTPQGGGPALRFEHAAPPRLEGVEWEVTGYNNGRQAVVGPKLGSRLTVTFRDGQVSGSSGCNRFHGAFTAQGNALTIQPLATTRMACEESTMIQEQEFLRALQSATTWNIVRGMLDIHRADGERVLTASEAGNIQGGAYK